MRWITGGMGALFALTVYNPNFTMRRSWYVRKFTVIVFSGIGWSFSNKQYVDSVNNCYLRMHDYFPLEIKRALRDKDFRHIALFDLKKAMQERQVFDPVTGKSLS